MAEILPTFTFIDSNLLFYRPLDEGGYGEVPQRLLEHHVEVLQLFQLFAGHRTTGPNQVQDLVVNFVLKLDSCILTVGISQY